MYVPDVDSAIEFYRGRLGLDLLWRRGSSEAGLKLRGSDTEIVLARDASTRVEVDVLVDSVDMGVQEIEASGGRISTKPFDIATGRCALVVDLWGNQFVIADMSKGLIRTDEN
jgi:lactoylglutathione lyase